jgi:hypothetical protein
MIEIFDGSASANKIANWCAQVCVMEKQAYGEGNNRSADLLISLCEKSPEGFLFAVENERVIGTADFWELHNTLYSGIMFDLIPEESLPLDLVLSHLNTHEIKPTGLWYLASFIILPEHRSKKPGFSPVYRILCQKMWSSIIAATTAYPIKLIGVVSSESGRNMMSGWSMQKIPTNAKKDRCEAVYKSAECLQNIRAKYAP